MKRVSYERQEYESKKAFEAFQEYRNMGAERSIRKVAEKLSKSETLIKRWSAQNNWVNRAADYDAELDRKALLQEEKDRREMSKRHAKQAMMFQGKVLEKMQRLNVDDLSPNDLIRWFTEAVKIERLSRGAATEIGDMKVTADVKKLNDDDLENRVAKYEELYEKIAKEKQQRAKGG